MLLLVETEQIDVLPGKKFVELAVSSDMNRGGLTGAHAGFGADGFRIHLATEEGNECYCLDEKTHNTMNEVLGKVTSESPFIFAINRQFLLEALAGIPAGEHAGEIYFHYSKKDQAVIITSSDMTRAAVIMPMNIEMLTPLKLPRIETRTACMCDIQGSSNCKIPGHKK